jgi:hypothetical protein
LTYETGRLAKDGISSPVSEPVIDGFEMVEVEENQGNRPCRTLALPNKEVTHFHEKPPVVKTGKVVFAAQLLNLALVLMLFA